jgi:hypothetical protein
MVSDSVHIVELTYLLPLDDGPWWGSGSESPGPAYLELGFPGPALGNGGRNSSNLSPDAEGGCRGEDVAEELGAPLRASFTAPA